MSKTAKRIVNVYITTLKDYRSFDWLIDFIDRNSQYLTADRLHSLFLGHCMQESFAILPESTSTAVHTVHTVGFGKEKVRNTQNGLLAVCCVSVAIRLPIYGTIEIMMIQTKRNCVFQMYQPLCEKRFEEFHLQLLYTTHQSTMVF